MSDMKRHLLQIGGLLAIALFLAYASSIPALANWIEPQFQCESEGGQWTGSNEYMGTCTYPAGNPITIDNCGENQTYSIDYIEGSQDVGSQTCAAQSSPESVYLGCASRVDGPNLDPVTVYLCYGYNGFINFTAGACPEMCLLSFVLPQGANRNLPDDALASLYVMLDDTDGSPYNGNYTVCFHNPDEELLTLYRFVSGEWRALNTSSRTLICAAASGDGAFYLGYPPQ